MDPNITAQTRRGAVAGAALLLALTVLPARAADTQTTHNVEMSGDLLQFGVPIVGLALTFLLTRDSEAPKFDFSMLAPVAPAETAAIPGVNWPGPALTGSPQHDFAVAFIRMEAATYGLKYSIDAERPNGGSESFPSGHTASAFMGAEFIRKQYGWGWGLPAYATAGWVGYSRVESNNHYWRDVIAGALIGIASNHDFGTIKLRRSELSIGPTMMAPEAVRAPAYASFEGDKDPGRFATDPFAMAPGMQVRWTF